MLLTNNAPLPYCMLGELRTAFSATKLSILSYLLTSLIDFEHFAPLLNCLPFFRSFSLFWGRLSCFFLRSSSIFWCLVSGVSAVFGVWCLVCWRCLVSGVWRCFTPYETPILVGVVRCQIWLCCALRGRRWSPSLSDSENCRWRGATPGRRDRGRAAP